MLHPRIPEKAVKGFSVRKKDPQDNIKGLITIQPSHFHEIFVGNTVTSGHQARTVSLNYFLEAQEQKIKRNKAKNKRQ